MRRGLAITTKSKQFARLGGLQARATGRVRIFCFAYAGGSPSAFAGWGERLGPEIEVLSAHLRGRAMRFSEPPDRTMAKIVEDLFEGLRTHLDLPYAFYGHSLGALMAFELILRLQREGLPLPEHFFIGASVPPHLGLIHEEIHHLKDAEFVTAIQDRYSGIPDAVLNEPELMEIFLPVLKADFTAYERYRLAGTERIEIPITAFEGDTDPGIPTGTMAAWEKLTEGAFELYTVPGGHFFLTESAAFVQGRIRERLLAIAERDSNVERAGNDG